MRGNMHEFQVHGGPVLYIRPQFDFVVPNVVQNSST